MPEFVKIKNKKIALSSAFDPQTADREKRKKLYKSKNDWEFKFFF